MNDSKKADLIRIGVFYDGNYFYRVSNYYNYTHERKSRIRIEGLHYFIKKKVAKEEEVNPKFCQIVDSHYFRGKLNAKDANHSQLYNERVFEEVLMSEGITTHFLPLKKTGVKFQEKGIDVLLALEAFELAFYKRFNVLVLIASDSDYVPLIQKLNTLGTRVMLLYWDFKDTDESGAKRETKTSQKLLDEVTYNIAMHQEIDKRVSFKDDDKVLIENLFYKADESKREKSKIDKKASNTGIILKIISGFGFIQHPDYPNNLFFHASSCDNFNSLDIDNEVTFEIAQNEERGEDVAVNVKKVED